MKRILVYVMLLIITGLAAPSAHARDAARDLRRMVGYTIVMAEAVDDVFTNRKGDKLIKLGNGQVFEVDFLFLDPLPLTDVIVFAKPLPKELTTKYNGKLPDHLLYSYKLLIDNEAFDAIPQ